eukprot:CAMPEP_0183381384 /NCGR_PEP_ID=MMETSP0164_2-20130417/126412_1 /TAXON_ID=221442 /ORGANISM="Coccolithus pelagicus ssp braarudi, Strain PLY182g" /LENGTH=40 /DNA_ID= /DNA_START= /DNA_END= /DNA_ORIENTATION=
MNRKMCTSSSWGKESIELPSAGMWGATSLGVSDCILTLLQ